MNLLYTRFASTLGNRQRLSQGPTEKPVFLLRFSCPETVRFEPGDIALVYPKNAPQRVEHVLSLLQIDGATRVQTDQNQLLSLHEALTTQYELRPRFDVLNPTDADFWSYVKTLRAQQPHLDAQTILKWFMPMRPRAYSIASAQSALPNALELLVSTLTFRNEQGELCEGLASGFLCNRLEIGETATLCVVPSRFHLPNDPNRPIIMIGPGTGLAPFKAFLEHRRSTHATGPMWLFFGGRNYAHDFILQTFLERLHRDNILTRLDTAFSRDQPEKVYVQHRMLEHANVLWEWLQQGAAIYICGERTHMAADVEATWLQIIAQQGQLSPTDAQQYLKTLRLNGRYQKDVY